MSKEMAVEGATAGRHEDPDEPVLRVRLLGGVDLRLGEVPLPSLESARAESLLAYLLLHRDAPRPRQQVAFTLWPESTDAQARTNLRHGRAQLALYRAGVPSRLLGTIRGVPER